MKKIIIAASMLAAAFVANAQEPTLQPTRLYKPVAGNLLAEIGFVTSGIGANPTELQKSPFGTAQLKFRYFLQDQIALRVGFAFNQSANTERFYEAQPGSGTGFARNVYSQFGLTAGLEKHFTGTGRLSTYAGGDVCFQKTSAASKWENSDGNQFVDGQTRTTRGYNSNPGQNGSFGFGLRAFAGADYYFVEKVYLGAEFGWGFIASKNSKTKLEETVGGVTNPTVETKSTGGSFNLAPSLNLGLRLGFIF